MKALILGATGYIGGAVAARLATFGIQIVALVREEHKAGQLRQRGMETVIGHLHEHRKLIDLARAADLVINASNADDPYPVWSLLAGLEGSGKLLIQTSGSSVVGDRSGGEASAIVYHEDTPCAITPEKIVRDAIRSQVLGAARSGVRAVVLCPSLIYGKGTGLNTHSIQIPKLIATAKKHGVVPYVGRGEHIWSHVHIEDVVEAYLMVVQSAAASGYFFLENGEASLKAIAESVARLLGLDRCESWSVDRACNEWGAPAAWYSLGGNSRVSAAKARALLNWRCRHTDLLAEIERGCYQELRGD